MYRPLAIMKIKYLDYQGMGILYNNYECAMYSV